MIHTFRHEGLAELWETGRTGRIDRRLDKRILVRLDVLEALRLEDLNVPGLGFHECARPRLPRLPPRYTVQVNGPWWVTFEWDAGDAVKVDFEQYH